MADAEVKQFPAHVSWSQIRTFNSCQKRYELRYVEGIIPQKSGAMLAGIAMHQAIAEAEEMGVPQAWAGADSPERKELADRLGAVFRGLLREAIADTGEVRWGGRKRREFPDGEDERWWGSQGPVMLRRWLAARRDDLEEGYHLWEAGAEKHLVADADGVTVRMVVDCVLLVTPDGDLVPRDWKTGSWPASPLQLAFYAEGISQAMGVSPWRGEIGDLRKPEGRIVKSYDLRALIPLVAPTVAAFVKARAVGAFLINPGQLCASCEVRQHCPWGATLE